MEPTPLLLGREGPLAGQQWVITEAGLRLGREPGNEVRIDDTGVSRQHARVLLHNGAVWVQDAGSRNGVFVNGERVPDHRQVKFGDRVTVGAHVFEIGLTDASAVSQPVPRPPAPPPERTWKIWPFAVAIFLVLGCVGCFGLYGWIRGDDEVAEAAAPPAYSLSAMLDEKPPEPAPTAPATVQDALAVAAGADAAAQRASLPDPPPGATVDSLVDNAGSMFESGRLAEARTHYQMALKLDPKCEICTIRIDRINARLAASAQEQFDAGMKAYESMHFTQAIASWESVLQLVPDPQDPMHLRAREYLDKARAQARP